MNRPIRPFDNIRKSHRNENATALLLTAVAQGAIAQYVDKCLGICAPQYFADTVQIAYDDPKAVYGLAPHLMTGL